MQNNHWFKWEREAVPHLLFPTLDGSMQPLKKYVGFSFPTTVLFFENGVVTWCMRESEFLDFGRRLREIYTDSKKEKRLVLDLKDALQRLKNIERKIDKTKLGMISKTELVDLYQQLYKSFLPYYAIGAISTPLSFETEIYLKQITNLSDEEIQALSTPKITTYINKAENYLLKTKNIKGFLRKYYWIDNNYSGAKVLTEGDVKKRIQSLQKAVIARNEVTKQSLIRSPLRQLADRDNDSSKREIKRLIQLLKHYAIYKDNRKKEILIYLHFVEMILSEVSSRTGISIDALRQSLPNELGLIIKGSMSEKELLERQKSLVVLWEENSAKSQILNRGQIEKWRKLIFVKQLDTKIITGKIASVGKVIGKVRVLLKSEDCDQLKKGEILVTFMTSPDFMSAMRKCSAIITNLGGVTSHAAIISRELGIPCIVGTKIATQVLITGDLVEVDANSGLVRKLNNG